MCKIFFFNFRKLRNNSLLTVSWLGLSTVEKTEGLNVGRCNVSIDRCDSKGFILEPLGVFVFPVDPLEPGNFPCFPAFGVSEPMTKTCRSILEDYMKY